MSVYQVVDPMQHFAAFRKFDRNGYVISVFGSFQKKTDIQTQIDGHQQADRQTETFDTYDVSCFLCYAM
jgi:hypothetical protein